MENFLIIGSILTIHIFAWFTPGPQIALIIRNSLIYSRKTGFWTAAGFAIGNFIHILISVIGLGLLISQSPSLHTAIKFLGVGYLAYLGAVSYTHLFLVSAIFNASNTKITPRNLFIRI